MGSSNNEIEDSCINADNIKSKIKNIGDDNSFAIINAIRRLEMLEIESSKTKIAASTGLSLPTISRALQGTGENSSFLNGAVYLENGNYRIQKDYAYFLGIHLGIRKIRISVCDFSLNNISKKEMEKFGIKEKSDSGTEYVFDSASESCHVKYFDSSSSNKKEFSQTTIYDIKRKISNIVSDILDAVEKNNLPLLSICIAIPAIYNPATMEVKHSSGLDCLINSKLSGLLFDPVKERVNKNNILFGFEHNTESVLFYEREKLYLKEKDKENRKNMDFNNIAVISLGTSIGAAFIVNGKLYRGRLGASGEIGHLRAPFIPDFKDRFGKEKLERYKTEEGFEENLELHDIERSMRPYLTLEDAIKYDVFNVDPADFDKYLERTSYGNLASFAETYPNRYKLLVQYASYVTNILVDLMSIGIIIYGGSICLGIDELVTELSNKKGEDALMCLSDETKTLKSTNNRDDVVATGAAYVAYYRCEENNRKLGSKNELINAEWKMLGGVFDDE